MAHASNVGLDQVDSRRERFLVEVANEKGRCLVKQGNLKQATDLLSNTLRDAERLGDEQLVAIVTNNLASVLLDASPESKGRTAQVVGMLESNIRRLKLSEDHRQLAVAYHHLGRAYARLGQSKAKDCLMSDVEMCRRSGDEAALADALDALGLLLTDQGQFGEARDIHEEEISLYQQLFDLGGEARALAHLARSFSQQFQREQNRDALMRARDLYQQSWEIAAFLNDPILLAPACENLGRVLYKLRSTARGMELLSQAIVEYGRFPQGSEIALGIREELNSLGRL